MYSYFQRSKFGRKTWLCNSWLDAFRKGGAQKHNNILTSDKDMICDVFDKCVGRYFALGSVASAKSVII